MYLCTLTPESDLEVAWLVPCPVYPHLSGMSTNISLLKSVQVYNLLARRSLTFRTSWFIRQRIVPLRVEAEDWYNGYSGTARCCQSRVIICPEVIFVPDLQEACSLLLSTKSRKVFLKYDPHPVVYSSSGWGRRSPLQPQNTGGMLMVWSVT
jgi:hypothetical protein